MGRITFNPGDDVYQIYTGLHAAGVTDADLDHGYHVSDYTTPGPNETLVGRPDGRIEEPEVFEYLFEHDEQFPDLTRIALGAPIAWSLDDDDPATTFDAAIREKVRGMIAVIDRLLRTQGLAPTSDVYKERMAVGLFYFTVCPDTPDGIARWKNRLEDSMGELAPLGLADLQDLLFANGGLGLLLTNQDATIENSALATLQQKRGWCTERSKVLYAVFRMAGLDPAFGSLGWQEIAKFWKQDPFSRDGHMTVVLRFGNRDRIFEPSMTHLSSAAPYRNYFRMRRMQYAADDINNTAIDRWRTQTASLPEIIAQLRRAIRCNPAAFIPRANLVDALLGLGRFEEPATPAAQLLPLDQWDIAVHEARTLAALCPTDGVMRGKLGWALLRTNRLDEALNVFQASIQIGPDYGPLHLGLGLTLALQGALDQGVDEARRGAHAKESGAASYEQLGTLLQLHGDLNEAAAAFTTVIHHDPNNAQARFMLGIVLARQDEPDKAAKELGTAMRLTPTIAQSVVGEWRTWIHRLPERAQKADLLVNVGLALFVDGQHADGLSAWKAALQFDPDCKDAKRFLTAEGQATE